MLLAQATVQMLHGQLMVYQQQQVDHGHKLPHSGPHILIQQLHIKTAGEDIVFGQLQLQAQQFA